MPLKPYSKQARFACFLLVHVLGAKCETQTNSNNKHTHNKKKSLFLDFDSNKLIDATWAPGVKIQSKAWNFYWIWYLMSGMQCRLIAELHQSIRACVRLRHLTVPSLTTSITQSYHSHSLPRPYSLLPMQNSDEWPSKKKKVAKRAAWLFRRRLHYTQTWHSDILVWKAVSMPLAQNPILIQIRWEFCPM